MSDGGFESDLVQQAVSGDREALERLLLLHYDRLARRIARRMPASLRRVMSEEDIIQQTFVSVFDSITAYPYADDPHTRGFMRMTDTEIEHETRRAITAGLDISTHAIGDDAVHRVLAAYTNVANETGTDPRRFRIEHFGYSSEEDMRAAASAGFLLVAQPNFIDPDVDGKTMEDGRLGCQSARA